MTRRDELLMEAAYRAREVQRLIRAVRLGLPEFRRAADMLNEAAAGMVTEANAAAAE